jgi:hypothetical protein
MNATPDRYSTWDAAYVLGSLSPAERREYEEHLAGCPACQAAVSELAGIPGLLAQVPPEDAALLAVTSAEDIDDSAPPSLLAAVRSRRAGRRRRMVGIVAGAAAAVLVVLAGVAYALGLLPLGPSGPQRVAFASVDQTPMIAVVDVIPAEQGTDLAVECVYHTVIEHDPQAYDDYRIYVIDRSGRAWLVKEYPIKPNKVLRPTARTELKVRQIATVEIRDSDNETLLRAQLR